MNQVRRHLRAWVAVWLVCQLGALSTLAERTCCAADAHAQSASCHSEAAPRYCPMRAAGGAPCPMHRESSGEVDCSLRGKCGGTVAALATLLSSPGPVETSGFVPVLQQQSLNESAAGHVSGHLPLPHTPPPRS